MITAVKRIKNNTTMETEKINYMLIPGIKSKNEIELEILFSKCCKAFNSSIELAKKTRQTPHIFAMQLFCYEAKANGYTYEDISKVAERAKSTILESWIKVTEYLTMPKANQIFNDGYQKYIVSSNIR